MLSLAAGKHANERIVAKNKVMNQCRGGMKARDDYKRMGEDFVDFCDIMRKGAVAYPR